VIFLFTWPSQGSHQDWLTLEAVSAMGNHQYFSNISTFGEIESVQQHQQIQAIPLDQDI
jgi:hypothetical protein